jgi:hypothetical protein
LKFGNSRSPTKDNFELLQENDNLTLRWKFFDPGDYFEFHVLLLSEPPDEQPSNYIFAEGIIAGNNYIEASGVRAVLGWRGLFVLFFTLPFLIFFIRKTDNMFDIAAHRTIPFVSPRVRSMLGFPIFMTLLMAPVLIVLLISVIVSTKLFWAPLWFEPLF